MSTIITVTCVGGKVVTTDADNVTVEQVQRIIQDPNGTLLVDRGGAATVVVAVRNIATVEFT